MSPYQQQNKRITFDTPISLRDKIHSIIPPSTLSAIMRNILEEIIELKEREGLQKTIHALLNKKVVLIIKPEGIKLGEQDEPDGI